MLQNSTTLPATNPDGKVDCFGDIPEAIDEQQNYYGIDLHPGQTLDGRFRLLRVISNSGMSLIFQAEDSERSNRPVAVKVPHRRLESDQAFFSRFLREEQIGLELEHPFILKFFPVEKKSRPYIVMEYLKGSTLWHLLRGRKTLPEKDAFKIAHLVCVALKYLHGRGVVHRDLKPGNIMFCTDRSIRLMDFGLATQSEYRKITFQGLTPMLGTPDYMSPEQVRNQKTDARTDIYGLGTIMYEMLTGVVPFAHENSWVSINDRVTGDPVAPRAVNPAISQQAEEIVLHCLQRNPDDRYQSVGALMAELEAPEKVFVSGYAKRLQKPHWRIGFHTTPMVFGALLGMGVILLQISAFFLLRHFMGHR
jgi:serine/threonine-protein kinase